MSKHLNLALARPPSPCIQVGLQLAEVLLEQYPEERAGALEHVDFAIAQFGNMKMQPALERALRREAMPRA